MRVCLPGPKPQTSAIQIAPGLHCVEAPPPTSPFSRSTHCRAGIGSPGLTQIVPDEGSRLVTAGGGGSVSMGVGAGTGTDEGPATGVGTVIPETTAEVWSAKLTVTEKVAGSRYGSIQRSSTPAANVLLTM